MEEQSRIPSGPLCSSQEAKLTWDKKVETQNYEQYPIDLHNSLPLSAIGIQIQRNQMQEELEAFLGREVAVHGP